MRPTVTLNGDLSDDTATVWAYLQRVDSPPKLFQRGNTPAWVDIDASGLITRDLSHARLRRFATDRLQFVMCGKNGPKPGIPKDQLFINMLSGLTLPLPTLNRITSVPTFSGAGELHADPGYSTATGNIYAPGTDFTLSEDVPLNPTGAKVREAISVVQEIICDFPFTSESSRTHALAALLQPFLREMIDGPTPLYLIFKPKEGTGSTLLAEVLAFPGCTSSHLMPFPNEEGERRRALSSTLSGSPECIVLDNVTELKSQVLASCLTSVVFRDRQVGTSSMIEVPNRCLWIATGNNPDLSGEMARRSVHINLDAQDENPDQRKGFKHPELMMWVRQNHGRIAWAALTLISKWIAAGRPAGERRMGSFESWSRVMGGIFDVAGMRGFLADSNEKRQKTDLQSESFRAFVEAWSSAFGCKEIPAKQLLRFADSLDLGSGEHAKRLGKLLQTRTDQRFGDWIVKRAKHSSGTQQWRLERVPGEVGVVDVVDAPLPLVRNSVLKSG